jgi:hypothetical protein
MTLDEHLANDRRNDRRLLGRLAGAAACLGTIAGGAFALVIILARLMDEAEQEV